MPPRAVAIRQAAILIVILAIWIIIFRSRSPLEIVVPSRSQAIGPRPGTDLYSEIAGTVFFKHRTGLSEAVFDFIYERINWHLYEARNVRFEYSPAANALRGRRACKIDNRSRLCLFLHQLRTGQLVWDSAFEMGWCTQSCSDDFKHCLYILLRELYDEVVCPMTRQEKDDMKGLFVNRKNVSAMILLQCLMLRDCKGDNMI